MNGAMKLLRSKLFPLILVPGLALCGLLVRYHNAVIGETRAQYTAEEIEAARESIALTLMGQFQLTAQSLVWLKTLEYLHNGVALRIPTEAEEECGFHAHAAVDVAAGLAHKCGVPVALNEEMDWRGPVGKLHRTVMPYQPIHNHSDPVELIPWYQLTLRLNPNLERLYTLGAFFMADFAQEPEQARELLETGIRENPWTFEIRAALGRLLFDYHLRMGMESNAAYALAAQALDEAIVKGVEEKERLGSSGSYLDAYQEQLLQESYLFLAKSLTELGRYDEALDVCEEGFKATGNVLLNAQKRITTKRMGGGEEETSSNAAAES